jgi:hypothetical protein
MLSKTGVTDVFPSVVTADVGSSPIPGAANLVTCTEIKGTIYSVNTAGSLPCRITSASRLTTAVGDMQAAYTDAAGWYNPTIFEFRSRKYCWKNTYTRFVQMDNSIN